MTATGYTTDARAVTSVEGRTGAVDVVKADVGLGSVDNTADADKPVSSATTTALAGKANTSHTHAAADVASGTLDVARVPTGTSGTTVALGNHTHAAGAWTVPDSYAANMSSAGSPYYTVGSRTEPNDTVRLRGRIAAGANYTAGATICTLHTSARPAMEVAFPVRVVGVGAANGSLTITTAGLVTYSANITVGAGTAWLLDGITYTLTA
jgi:hypothetical protein